MHRADSRSPLYGRIDKVKVAAALALLSSRMTKFISSSASPIVRRTCLSDIHALVISAAPIFAQAFSHWTFEKPSWKELFHTNTTVSGSTPPNKTIPTSHGLSAVLFFLTSFPVNFIGDNSKRCLEGTVIPIGLLRYRSGVWNTGI